jgi:hypothetical protein
MWGLSRAAFCRLASYVPALVMAGGFLYSTSQSVERALGNFTMITSHTVDVDTIQYPSVSVCKKFTFDHRSVSNTILSKLMILAQSIRTPSTM